jgi:hypothetical protein
MARTLLNPSQAAKVIGVSRPGFLKMVERGDIEPEMTVGRQDFFTPQSVRGLKRRRDNKNGRKTAKKR